MDGEKSGLVTAIVIPQHEVEEYRSPAVRGASDLGQGRYLHAGRSEAEETAGVRFAHPLAGGKSRGAWRRLGVFGVEEDSSDARPISAGVFERQDESVRVASRRHCVDEIDPERPRLLVQTARAVERRLGGSARPSGPDGSG